MSAGSSEQGVVVRQAIFRGERIWVRLREQVAALMPSMEQAAGEDVETYTRRLTIRIAQAIGVLLCLGVLAVWPTDFLAFRDRPDLFEAFAKFRASTVFALVFALGVTEYIYRNNLRYYWVVSLLFLLNAVILPFAFVGQWLADPTEPHYYAMFALASINILMCYPLPLRIVSTASLVGAWVILAIVVFPEYSVWETKIVAIVLVSFFGICSILVGHGYYLLIRSHYERAQELRAERQRVAQANEQLGRLFANVSHEMRTPLTIIQGNIQRIGERLEETPDSQRWRAGLERNAARLSILVDQFLSISRQGQSARTAQRRAIDLGAFVGEVIAAVYSSVDPAHYPQCPAPDDEAFVFADPIHLADMLFNLLANAKKFSESARQEDARVVVEWEVDDAWVRLRVRDNGHGIAPERLATVFHRYTQLHDEATLQLGGVGLGLSIVNELAALNGGRVEAERLPEGSGASFVLTLERIVRPLVDDKPTALELQSVHPLSVDVAQSDQLLRDRVRLYRLASHGARGLVDAPAHDYGAQFMALGESAEATIFVIDDEHDVLEYLVDTLRHDALNLYAFSSAESALEVLEALKPQLIVSDLMMHPMDGAAFLEELRQRPGWEHVPVLMVSANHDVEARVELLENGAVDFLTKPFHDEELMARVWRHIELHAWMNSLLETVESLEATHQSLSAVAEKGTHSMVANAEFAQELAQVIHDDFGQLIASCSVELSLAQYADTLPEVSDSLGRLRKSIVALTESFRRTLRALSQATLPETSVESVRNALNLLREHCVVRCREDFFDTLLELPPSLTESYSWTLQELFTNALRHASASTVEVELDINESYAKLRVSDDGQGMEPAVVEALKETGRGPSNHSGTSFGLSGIFKRTAALRGAVDVESSPGQGTVIVVTLPIS